MKDDNEGLSRYLSPLSVWALSFGSAVGWGAFVMPGTQFLPLAGPLGTTIGLFIGAIIMIILGRNYHFLMQRYEGSGGTFTYTRKIFNSDHGFLSAWFLILAYISIAWANLTALALITRSVLGSVLQFGFHYTLAGYDIYFGEVLFQLCVLALCTLIVAFRKRLAVWIQLTMALILILGILLCLIFVLSNLRENTSIKPLFSPDGGSIASQIFNIITLAPWAFIGFGSVSHSSGEFNFNKKKAFAIMTVAVITGYFAYTLLSDIAVLNQPHVYADWADYVGELPELGGRASMPVFNSLHMSAGDIGIIVITVVVFAAIITGIIGNMVASSRLIFSMANNDILPKWFKKQAADTTPCNAVIFLGLVSAVIPFFGRTAIGWIVDVTSIGAVIAYGYTSMAAYKLARQENKTGVKITGLIGVVLAIVFGAFLMIPNLVSTSSLSPESYLILTAWSILGFLYFRFVFTRDERRRFGRSTVVWLVLLFIIFFTSLMWMRQQTYRNVENSMTDINKHYIETMEENGMDPGEIPEAELKEYMSEEVSDIGGTLTFNALVQMALIVVAIIIMISVYTLILRRGRQSEIEKLKAEENSKAKSVFLSNMSHDIRTPMNAIIGYINLSKKEDITLEELKEYMDKIEGSSGHLLALINDVLEMSRIESGKMELEPIETNIVKMMDDVRDMFTTQMSEKKINYTVVSENISDPVVFCDKNRLNRVLLNLISNAYKFTPEGGEVSVKLCEINEGAAAGTVTLEEHDEVQGELTQTPVKYGFYELRVKDSGIGMTEEFAARVFEAFERERTSTVSGIQGTGLGMAITKSIVDLMGGTIDVDSRVGEGTEFIVHFPLEVVEKNESDEENSGIAGIGDDNENETDFTGRRLLLVEDMDINREIATMILVRMGFEIETAVDGAEAVQKVRAAESGYFDAVLMDIQMPVMDGYEATQMIRAGEENSDIPIIAMTANAFSEDIKKAHDSGMNGHVAKPIDIGELSRTLSEVIR
ncbi:MAG: amino acid permease [Eubacterium sp.]|nr:amino acid permease [Eubacterium sp.]